MSGNQTETGHLVAGWPVFLAGGLILLISLAHVPSAWDALNYFDPPKRLLWALMALILVWIGYRRENRLGKGPLWMAFGLLFWMGARTLFCPIPAAGLEVLFTWMMPILMMVVAGGLDHRRGARILGGSLLLAGLIQAGLMLLQRVGWDPVFAETTSVMIYKPGRMIGTIGYQNQAVDVLALCGAGIFMLKRSSLWRLVVLLPLFFIAGLTGSRGGILAFIAALLVSQGLTIGLQFAWSWRMKGLAGLGILITLLAAVATLAWIPVTRNRFQEAILDFRNAPATASRILMGRAGVEMIKEKPLIGWGAGSYAYQYLDRIGPLLPEEKTHPLLDTIFYAREAHNDGLQFVAEFGLVGVLFIGALLWVLLLRLVRGRKERPAALVTMGFILTYMGTACLFSFPWQTSMAGSLAGFLIGWWWPKQPKEEHFRVTARITCIWTTILALGLVVCFGWDAVLNLAVPKRLVAGDPQAAEALLPIVDFRYRALVGAAYAEQGDLDDARRTLKQAGKGFQDVLLWNNLNHVWGKTGEWEDCVVLCEKWVRCGLDYSNATRNLSIAYEQAGRFSEAAETLDRQMRFWHMRDVPDIKRLAVLQLQSGHPQAALDTLLYYQEIWESSDSISVAEMENLQGAVYLSMGDKLEAEKWFRSALERNPGLVSARRNLKGLSALANSTH